MDDDYAPSGNEGKDMTPTFHVAHRDPVNTPAARAYAAWLIARSHWATCTCPHGHITCAPDVDSAWADYKAEVAATA